MRSRANLTRLMLGKRSFTFGDATSAGASALALSFREGTYFLMGT